jgi:large subunit ribosomal protein L25
MEKIVLNAIKRKKFGKGAARQLRNNGFIPCIIYKNNHSVPIQIASKEIMPFMDIATKEKLFITLKFENAEKQAILQDYDVDPVTGKLLHVDFLEVSATEKIRVTVPIVLIGEPIGVKQDKGILQHGISEIEIEAVPEKIPGHIEVDVSHLEVGDTIHVSDLKIEDGIKLLSNLDDVIASLTVETEETEITSFANEVVEPEVIKKGKKAKEE